MFVRYAITPLPLKVMGEVTKLEKRFLQAILQMRSVIKPRMLPVPKSLFKHETIKHRIFELLHRFVLQMKHLVYHGKWKAPIQAKHTISALQNPTRHTQLREAANNNV